MATNTAAASVAHDASRHTQPPTSSTASQPSPPSKRDLRSWWKGFSKIASKHEEPQEATPQSIFGVPLRQSITYANVAISLVDDNGKSYIYGYVPIVVAKCGVFLKEKATGVEGIFRLNGSEKRIKELKHVFDSPDRYGKGLSWDGYTVHDAANVLRRYLNDLPEPVVPLDLYEKFREPLRGATKTAVGDAEGPHFIDEFDAQAAILRYQRLITEVPPLNRQLLLYILDLLAVFAAKADENRMNSQNLAAIFQPGMLSHPMHAMVPDEYRLNQCVLIFLIENQDHFLIGMQGTAADEKTVQELQKGTPTIVVPTTPGGSSRRAGVHRSESSASAGADSVSREGQVRRNKSTSSRRSRQSNGAPSPGSPAMPTTPSGGGLGRSNTVPSKKSPALQTGRFGHARNDLATGSPSPLTPVVAPSANIPATPTVHEALTPDLKELSDSMGRGASPGHLAPAHAAARSQERLVEPKTAPDATGPPKDRSLHNLFLRSPTEMSDKKPPNKLRKKRLPGSASPSAASSTTSLHQSVGVSSPNTEAINPLEKVGESEGAESAQTLQVQERDATETPSGSTPRASEPASTSALPAQKTEPVLKAQTSDPTSLRSSAFEESEPDKQGERVSSPEQPDKEKRRRWRLSRKKEDMEGREPSVTSPRRIGFNRTAETSNSSVGESWDPALEAHSSLESGKDSKDESRGISGWIKNKLVQTTDLRRAKSPPAERNSLASPLPIRGKSLDIKRSTDPGKDASTLQKPRESRPSASES